jgi:hypothetical protein
MSLIEGLTFYRCTASHFIAARFSTSIAETEPITDVGARLGWTVVSMAHDWGVVFPTVS